MKPDKKICYVVTFCKHFYIYPVTGELEFSYDSFEDKERAIYNARKRNSDIGVNIDFELWRVWEGYGMRHTKKSKLIYPSNEYPLIK